jgi:Aromatic acid exporter family member 2
MSLISFASQAYGLDDDTTMTQWQHDFRRLMGTINPTSHATSMVLSLLSASIREAQPLPPYLPIPQPYGLSARLEELDGDILSLRHVNEPGYAVFAVLQLSSRCIFLDMQKLVTTVKELVGEMDFSYHVVNEAGRTSSSAASGHDGAEGEKAKGD